MPPYLSPGVYVEEVEAGSRPIEGVGTAVAAFVGLAARGEVNKPILVTNWSQFTQEFGDFIEGSYLAHAVYGYFLNGGGACYVVRIGADGAMPAAQAELKSAQAKDVAGYRIRAIDPGPDGNDLTVEVSEPTLPTENAFKLVVKRDGKVEETFDNVTTSKGKQNVVTIVKAQSKLIQIEEVGNVAIAERVPAAGAIALAGGGASSPVRVSPDDYVGNSADRTGFAGLEAVDDVTMLAVPDLMAVYQQGVIDLEGVQAVQLAMIAHCELMGDRVAILDSPPGLNAQQIKEWRVDKAGYDSKYATLYWPWFKVFDPLSGSAAFVPPSGHMAGVWARNDDSRGVHKAPANEVVRGAHHARAADHEGRARLAQPGRHQLHPRVPRPRHPDLGCPDAFERPGVALPQRPAPLQLRRGVGPRRHPVGRLRAERSPLVAARQAHDQCLPPPHLARRGAVRGDPGGGVLCQVRRRDEPSRGDRRRAAGRRDRDRSCEAG